MTDVTDKMVKAAWDVWWWLLDSNRSGDERMRSAIEAALAAREPLALASARSTSAESPVDAGDLVKRLRGVCHEGNRICDIHPETADALDELVEVLSQAVSDFGEGHCVCEQTKRQCIDLITRMGVKL